MHGVADLSQARPTWHPLLPRDISKGLRSIPTDRVVPCLSRTEY